MLVRYHWGYGVGHTYTSGARATTEDFSSQTTSNARAGADVAAASSVPAETEDQEVRPSVENEDGSDECSLGEDDMVYQNDSDGSVSGDGFDDEACHGD
jgi:hypothetical protein